jgi:hypothetical protein
MKRITTIICCIAFMFAGISAAFMDFNPVSNKTMMAATVPPSVLQWDVTNNRLPLDLQLDLDKRLSHETPIKDSINIVDSVRWVEKVRWKTRYKNVADRTTAREVGEHLMAVMPDSASRAPTITRTLEREEQPNDIVCSPNERSIQLTVDGVVVYQSEDVNHSTEESQ